jgi:Arc/MetJ-type ribon-helix-helix transcriptional regulator
VSAIRLSPELTASIDKWAARNRAASRSDAIRRLVELGLAGSMPAKQTSPKAAAKASDMAAHQIDKLANPAVPEEERRARKRRLIKGPSEFRGMRGDQPKPKG